MSEPASDANMSLDALLEKLGIEHWDALLVGDGSGSKWGQACGWASILIEKDRIERRIFYGAANNGTVNIAEINAYIIPALLYLAEKQRTGAAVRQHVHILTDSQYVANVGEAASKQVPGTHSILWAMLQMVQRFGLNIHWHWLNREEVQLNALADHISRTARLALQRVDVPDFVSHKFGLKADTSNP